MVPLASPTRVILRGSFCSATFLDGMAAPEKIPDATPNDETRLYAHAAFELLLEIV